MHNPLGIKHISNDLLLPQSPFFQLSTLSVQIWTSTLFSFWKRDVQNIHVRETSIKTEEMTTTKKQQSTAWRHDTLHKNPILFLFFSNYYEISRTSTWRDATHSCAEDLTLYVVKQIILKFYRKAVCLTETKELVQLIKLKVHILPKTTTSTKRFTGIIFLVPLWLTSDLKHVSYITYFFFSPGYKISGCFLFL